MNVFFICYCQGGFFVESLDLGYLYFRLGYFCNIETLEFVNKCYD